MTVAARRVLFWSLFILSAGVVAPVAAQSDPRRADMQGDAMIWMPGSGLAPNCSGGGNDPTTDIACLGPGGGNNGVPQGLLDGWVWTLKVINYTASQRQALYAAVKNPGGDEAGNHYTHFLIDVSTDCVGTRDYHGLYPDCTTLPAKYHTPTFNPTNVSIVSVGDVMNLVLQEIRAAGLITACEGVSPDKPAASGLNPSLCDVAVTDFDNSTDAECRIKALSDTFPTALLYYELPGGVIIPTAGGSCSPRSVGNDGANWIQYIKTKYPNFSGVAYEGLLSVPYMDSLSNQQTYLTNTHGFWGSTQEVRFEIDTYPKFWYNLGATATPAQSYKDYNDALQGRVTWLHGFMSGGTTHTPPPPPAPQVQITSPASGSIFSLGQTITILATATDPSASGSLRVDFHVDGKAPVSVSSPPYVISVTNASGGSHTVYATAVTGYGVSATSATVTFSVAVPDDFDQDGKADLTIWRDSTGSWFTLTSSSSYGQAAYSSIQWGASGDSPRLGRIDTDGKPDLVVWRPSGGTWYWLTSSTGYSYASAGSKQWGTNGDTAFLGDIDGDGLSDLILWRPSNGTWYWLTSSTGYDYGSAGSKQWGNQSLGDVPLIADIDGDGKADLIVWRASTGTWYWLTSSTGYAYASQGQRQWGNSSYNDVPLLGDIDGDGKVDLIVWRPSTGGATWLWLTSSTGYDYGSAGAKQWGNQSLGDVPLLGDIDGDGKADLIVWRPNATLEATWYWLTSSSGYAYSAAGSKPFGNQSLGDVPIIR